MRIAYLAAAALLPVLAPALYPHAQAKVAAQRADNAEMAAIFDADQANRSAIAQDNPQRLHREDSIRRARTRELLDEGALATAQDFFYAAFVFQHGTKKEDYLLAHILATAAAKLGRPDTRWLVGTTLDRYLLATGEDQVFDS